MFMGPSSKCILLFRYNNSSSVLPVGQTYFTQIHTFVCVYIPIHIYNLFIKNNLLKIKEKQTTKTSVAASKYTPKLCMFSAAMHFIMLQN